VWGLVARPLRLGEDGADLAPFTKSQRKGTQLIRMRKVPSLLALTALLCCVGALAFAASASAANTVLTFKEPEKGSTFAFVDNAPKSQLKHGFPTAFSAGDEIIFTNPLEAEGKTVGKIRVVCTATKNASSEHFAAAGFLCSGLAKIPGGSLAFAALLSEGATEGAVTGGTGSYAGASGTFVSKEGKGSSTVTITLLG
jgi:hypothetical protein